MTMMTTRWLGIIVTAFTPTQIPSSDMHCGGRVSSHLAGLEGLDLHQHLAQPPHRSTMETESTQCSSGHMYVESPSRKRYSQSHQRLTLLTVPVTSVVPPSIRFSVSFSAT